jgi:hypothetical protein
MNISEKEFHKRLLEYFVHRYEDRDGLTEKALSDIIAGLTKLTDIESKFSGRDDITVHISNIFGLKIK